MSGASHVQTMLFEGLMRLEPDGSLCCAQAQSYDISHDQKTYTFHLRNSFWSDETPVTARDFELTWKNILTPSFPCFNAQPFFFFKNAAAAKRGDLSLDEVGIYAKDEKTLILTLEKPVRYFLQLLASSTFFPVNQTQDQHFPDWYLEAGEHFVCNGPFKLTMWKHHCEMRLEKNKHYHSNKKIKLDSIQICMINQGIASLHIDASGLFDLIGPPFSSLPCDLYKELVHSNLLHIAAIPGTATCTFNVNSYPFHNVNIRKAFALSIDRQLLVNTTTLLKEQPALGIVPPMLKKGAFKPFFTDNDVSCARKYLHKGLDELGIQIQDLKNQIIFSFWKQDHACPMLPQALQKQWKDKLHIDVQLEALEFNALHEKGRRNAFSMGYFVHIATACDPIILLDRFKFSSGACNYSGWQSDIYIDLLNRSEQTQEEEKCFLLTEEAEKVLMEEMPFAPLFYWNNALLVQPHVQGLAISRLGYLCFDRISIKKKQAVLTLDIEEEKLAQPFPNKPFISGLP